MEDRPGETATGTASMVERFFDEVGAQVVCDREADEDPIGSWRSEVTLDQVSEYKAMTLTLCCRDLTFFGVAAQLKLPHNPGDALMVDRSGATVRIVESQLGGNAFCAVELPLVVEDGLDLGSEYGIINQSAVPLGAASFPFVVGAAV